MPRNWNCALLRVKLYLNGFASAMNVYWVSIFFFASSKNIHISFSIVPGLNKSMPHINAWTNNKTTPNENEIKENNTHAHTKWLSKRKIPILAFECIPNSCSKCQNRIV